LHYPNPKEPLRSKRRRQLWSEHLHGNIALVLEIASEIHRCHATAAQHALNGVAIC
jgi:hypothetical protein